MINIFKLNQKRDQTEVKKEFIFGRILTRIHTKIKSIGEKGQSHAIYIIPKVILGLPIFDQVNCAAYCVNKLRYNGFIVLYTYPNLLFISWGHVPSTFINPEYKPIAYEILRKPDRDYSHIIKRISDLKDTKKIEN